MPYFNQSDLRYADYVWHSRENHDDPTKTHFPDNRLLATHEGYEMLTFINAVARMNGWAENSSKGGGQKVERMLKTSLPDNVRGRANVYNWLVSNWNSFDF